MGKASTLAERIRWILANRRAPNGAKWSGKSLARAAHVADTLVGMMARGEVSNSRRQTIDKIAEASGVSPMWLNYGTGGPDDPPQDPTGAPSGAPAPEAPPRVLPETPLEQALALAFSPPRHSVRDIVAVQAVLGPGRVREAVRTDADLTAVATMWLDAAAQLRLMGEPVTVQSLLVRVSIAATGKGSEDLKRRGDDATGAAEAERDRLGLDPVSPAKAPPPKAPARTRRRPKA